MKSYFLFLTILTTTISSCTNVIDTRRSKAGACVDSFATHYFNYQFQEALPFCTPESEKWLRYAASNIHEADIDELRKLRQATEVEVSNVSIRDERHADVEVWVSHFMRLDTIGTRGHIVPRAHFVISAEEHNDQWQVHLCGLPRMEKP